VPSHGFGVVEITRLDDNHGVAVEFEHLPNELIALCCSRVAVQTAAHAVKVDRRLRFWMQPIRRCRKPRGGSHGLAALAGREVTFAEDGVG